MSKRLSNFLFRIFNPSFWFQNYPSDDAIDILLNVLMDADAPVKVGSHQTELGSLIVWTSNWPYAYGTINGMGGGLAYPITRIRLKKYIARKVGERELERMRGPQ